MKMIVAVDRNWAIGNENRLLVSIPADMKYFRETTMGKVVVMGRKTLESFPGGRPLKNRTNIVLTTRDHFQAGDAIICRDLPQLFEVLHERADEEVFCIGGASVYRALLPYCDTVYVTRIDHAYQADAYFPDLDRTGEWEITWESDEQTYFDLEIVFRRCERKPEFPAEVY